MTRKREHLNLLEEIISGLSPKIQEEQKRLEAGDEEITNVKKALDKLMMLPSEEKENVLQAMDGFFTKLDESLWASDMSSLSLTIKMSYRSFRTWIKSEPNKFNQQMALHTALQLKQEFSMLKEMLPSNNFPQLPDVSSFNT